MSNAMSAMSREERDAIREGRLHGPGDYFVEVSHEYLTLLVVFAELSESIGPQTTCCEVDVAARELRKAL